MNTREDNSLQRLKLTFEQTPTDEERVAEAIANNWARSYKRIVLFINDAGLISLMRFGRRS